MLSNDSLHAYQTQDVYEIRYLHHLVNQPGQSSPTETREAFAVSQSLRCYPSADLFYANVRETNYRKVGSNPESHRYASYALSPPSFL